MSENEIKLTTTDNKTSSGIPFPETPKPQIIKEQFSRIKTSNPNTEHNSDPNNN